MRRSSVRCFAVVILALFGAPVAMHVLVHDLHDDDCHPGTAYTASEHHGNHEHPIISSAATQVPNLVRAALPVAIVPANPPASLRRMSAADRNVIAFGALRLEDDVGLQPLLSTFLI
jgi:hypothetical protein